MSFSHRTTEGLSRRLRGCSQLQREEEKKRVCEGDRKRGPHSVISEPGGRSSPRVEGSGSKPQPDVAGERAQVADKLAHNGSLGLLHNNNKTGLAPPLLLFFFFVVHNPNKHDGGTRGFHAETLPHRAAAHQSSVASVLMSGGADKNHRAPQKTFLHPGGSDWRHTRKH